MPIDPSIALGVKPPQFESPTNALAQMLQVQAAQQQNQLGQAKLDEYQRGVERTNRLRDLLANVKPDASTEDQVGTLTRGGYLTEARSLAESSAKVAKDKRDAEKAQLEAMGQKLALGAQILGSVKDQATYDAARQTAQQAGLDVSNMPPQYDAAFVAAKRTEGLTALEQVEQHWKQKGYDLEVKKADETARHNGAVEKTSAGQLTVSQGQLSVAKQREKREANAPRGQIVQSDTGTLLVDPRTGTGKAVTGPDGQPVGPKLKDIPASVNTAMIANGQSLAVLDRTIALLEGKDQGVQLGDSAATGLKGYLPQQLLNKVDPKGIDARAGVADIGSLKLHDRSGAAVTASESPRLMPFIPTSTDSNETALKKLKRLRLEAQNEASALAETYSKDAGYRASPIAARNAGQGGVPATNAKGWALHVDAAGNKAYVSPDGKSYEEVK